jgi:hypothetical protein
MVGKETGVARELAWFVSTMIHPGVAEFIDAWQRVYDHIMDNAFAGGNQAFKSKKIIVSTAITFPLEGFDEEIEHGKYKRLSKSHHHTKHSPSIHENADLLPRGSTQQRKSKTDLGRSPADEIIKDLIRMGVLVITAGGNQEKIPSYPPACK